MGYVQYNYELTLKLFNFICATCFALIGIGRIKRGKIKANSTVKIIDREGKVRNGRVLQIMGPGSSRARSGS